MPAKGNIILQRFILDIKKPRTMAGLLITLIKSLSDYFLASAALRALVSAITFSETLFGQGM